MKVLPFKIPKPENNTVIFQIDKAASFYDKLHQHEEIQLSFIVKGEGTLLVGDTITYFKTGDVFVIGSHAPHVFRSDVDTINKSHMLSLFFTETSFGSDFFNLAEMQAIQPFFDRSKHGFKINSNQDVISELFLQLEDVSKFDRFIILLQLLKVMAFSEFDSLSSFVYDKRYSVNEGHRMRNVFDYTMANFAQDISLATIANVANMSNNAFCKYFKKRTNKTYVQFLNELRIAHACRMLMLKTQMSVTEVAEQSGFNNISNFNRHFKFSKHMSPRAYRKTSGA